MTVWEDELAYSKDEGTWNGATRYEGYGDTWRCNVSGISITKGKKGMRYVVRGGVPGSATYDLTGSTVDYCNNWRRRLLSNYNERVDFFAAEEEE